ncbi:hypothetical protein P8452_46878 [Trifolium repens]|nr:hypothetical protein P8452_46878 [Trifolium repens]
MDPGQGKAALQVFHNFEAFQCVPNQDTYYFTLHSLSTTKSCSDDMIHQAASICQNMLLLFPNDTTPPDDDHHHHHEQDIIASAHFFKIVSDDFCTALSFLGGIPPVYFRGCVCADLNLTDFNPMRQHLHHFILKTIETSCQTILIETRKVSSPHNLIHFVKWAWRRSNNNKYLITTPVLESLVSATCDGSTYLYDFSPRKNNIRFLWDLLKHIGHRQSGLLNTRILNQLIYSFGFMLNHRKTALEVFHKFEVFQCEPNRDTYTFTLKALWSARRSTDISHQAASICQKMSLHPETLLPDDGELLGNILSWFSQNNMTEEAYALYLAAKRNRKQI